jgi:hypothetical protein
MTAPRFADDFGGDDALLLDCIDALLDLDRRGALVPSGLGGHSRTLLSAAACRLSRHSPAIAQPHRLADPINTEGK